MLATPAHCTDNITVPRRVHREHHNGGPAEAPAANPAPQLMVLAQYIKDLSFENPNAPKSLQQTTQPQIDISVNVTAIDQRHGGRGDLRLEGKAEAAAP